MPSDGPTARRWLDDMLHHISLAHGFVEGMTFNAFEHDDLRLYAVTRCLEIILEASRKLPEVGERDGAFGDTRFGDETKDDGRRRAFPTFAGVDGPPSRTMTIWGLIEQT